MEGAGAKASRPLGGDSSRSPSLCPSRPMLPARTARTPRPQQNLPGPPSLKGYDRGSFSLDFEYCIRYTMTREEGL